MIKTAVQEYRSIGREQYYQVRAARIQAEQQFQQSQSAIASQKQLMVDQIKQIDPEGVMKGKVSILAWEKYS